ncbi:MAG: glycosyltransferase [Oscillospiraceae bacterium]|nr:glycosyltransferase [Oscillospiraceae bacterium]
MNILILSCNTGQGHNSCAEALRETFAAHGDSCEVRDALAFISEEASRFMCSWFVRVYRHAPRAFSSGYTFCEQHPNVFAEDSAAYHMLTSGTERLHDFLCGQNYDAVVCTHVFSALMLTDVRKKYNLPLPSAFVATDYTCSPGMEQSDLDIYFIPDASLAEEFARCGIAREKLTASGLPVRRAFYNRTDKAAARQRCGVDKTARHMLVMCGSMGCGPIHEIAERLHRLSDSSIFVTIICGTNTRLRRQLLRATAGDERIKILGYTDQVPLLMDSADLYLTKPGGISVTEAAVKGLPMVLINAVAGCETYNMDFFLAAGAAVTAESAEELTERCTVLLKDGAAREVMSRKAQSLFEGNAAEKIYGILSGGGINAQK